MLSTTVHVVPPPHRSLIAFTRWVAEDCDAGACVLDIGAGANASGPLNAIVRKSPRLVGVDPHETIHSNHLLDERHQTTLEAFAADHGEAFDVAFAAYVLEHVTDPQGFTAACFRVLKPGGSFFGLTPNVLQYFGATTWALARVGLSDRVLEALKGHDEGQVHHFAPEYRINSIRRITRHLDAEGFSSVEFRCFDATERYQWYLPRGLGWFPPRYARLAYRLGAANLMGHISFRAVK